MNSQVCENCQNKKPVNLTTNRLVTESCGHVKCMECLLQETSGCVACSKTACNVDSETVVIDNIHVAADMDVSPKVSVVYNVVIQQDTEDKKKKLETSHIKVETDANGRCYVCTVCSKRFHARSQVAYHAYCNGQRKPYQCPECNKSFATHSHYKYHMRVHRNERTYACDVCGDSFFQMSKLQRHKLKHTKEKKYKCSECSKGFKDLPALRKHGLTHTDERPYCCATCGRRFRDSSNYRKHVAKHEGAACGVEAGRRGARRVFACARCPQAFHSSKDLRRHASTHTDCKPFRCKVCHRRFRRKDNLERHIRNTHPDFIPSAAVEFDDATAKQTNGEAEKPDDKVEEIDKIFQNNEKTKLEKLNPLPPLAQDIINKHMHTEFDENNSQSKMDIEITDKSYIIEANNARESVIFGPVNQKPVLNKPSSPPEEFCYVHKIRKAVIPLPPVDENKIRKLQDINSKDDLAEPLPPPTRNVELYKKILYERTDKDGGNDVTKLKHTSPEMHWKRKLKVNIN